MMFRLLDLPPELWLRIGQLAVDSANNDRTDHFEPFNMYQLLVTTAAPVSCVSVWQDYLPPPITLVCKTLRHEMLSYHYRSRFKCYIFAYNADWTIKVIGTWLRAIGPIARSSLEDVVCYVAGNEDDITKFEARLKELFRLPVKIVETAATDYGTHKRKNYILQFSEAEVTADHPS